jgi:hypothetical protein
MLKNGKFATNWRNKVTELLRNRPLPITLEKIEEDTKIDKAWLKLLSRGAIDNPGINRMETLYNYLISIRNR